MTVTSGRWRLWLVIVGLAGAAALASAVVGAQARPDSTTPATVGPSVAVSANGDSMWSSLSANGHYVAFASEASNLVVGDTNEAADMFVRDRARSTTERVSMSSGGAQANGRSGWAAISADGRFIAFDSEASNLAVGDTNGAVDMFVRDRGKRTTARVSVSSGGEQANGASGSGAISADGRVVAFQSSASNLVAGDTNECLVYGSDRNQCPDVFVRDRARGTTERVSVSSGGEQTNGFSDGPAISANGRFVAFASTASNLVAGDTNGAADVFVRDRARGRPNA